MEKNPFHESGGLRPSHGSRAARVVGWVFLGIAFAVAFALVFGIVVKLLWNWLMPAIFGLSEISYWQAFGLVILAKLLFGAFGHRHNGRFNHSHKRFAGWKENFCAGREKEEMREDWQQFRKYWQEEGKADFEDYLQRKKGNKEEKNGD